MHVGRRTKGKPIDHLAHDKDTWSYDGRGLSGHTVVVDDQEYKLHLTSPVILHPETLVSSRTVNVLDPVSFVGEIEHLQGRGVTCSNLKASGTHAVPPHHRP